MTEDEILLAEIFNAKYISKDNDSDKVCFWTELPEKSNDYFFPQHVNDYSFMGSIESDIFFSWIESGALYEVDFDNKDAWRLL